MSIDAKSEISTGVATNPVRIAVLMTAHNRKVLTLRSIEAINAACPPHVELRVFLTDDGSTDGTSEAVATAFPEVTILEGSGDLFWNRGMRKAWLAAASTPVDFFLWLNDDLAVFPDAIETLFRSFRAFEADSGGKLIIIGKTVHPQTGVVTYGGFARVPGFSRLRFRRMSPGDSEVATMNGNLVLMPASVLKDIGILSEKFTHSFGDIDYGLRARRAGYRLLETEKPVGNQEYNYKFVQNNSTINLKNWRTILFHPKGVPWREWFYFCRVHGGPLWPVNFLFRYAKMIAVGLFARGT